MGLLSRQYRRVLVLGKQRHQDTAKPNPWQNQRNSHQQETNMMSEVANAVSDFNESDWKQFAVRVGDRWSFSIPPKELQEIDSLIPNHVLGVQNIHLEIGKEAMLGKLVRKVK
jgi:hypothetical protein